MTAHLYLFYVVAAKIYYWQVSVILALFTLFRGMYLITLELFSAIVENKSHHLIRAGKKKNVLRDRIDSAEYDLDQLLLGTILFTLLVFLFPTVAVYYVLFSLVCVDVEIGKVLVSSLMDSDKISVG